MRRAIAGLLVVCFAAAAAGQTADEERFDRRMEQFRRETRFQSGQSAPIGQQMLFQYGAYAEFDYFSLDDRNHDNHGGREYSLTGYARADLWDAHEFFVRARADYRTFNEGDSFNGKGDYWVQPALERAYYRFDLRNQVSHSQGKLLDWDVSFKGGRDLSYWANGLVVSQILDGGVIDLSYHKWGLEAIGGITPGHTVDFDTSRPHFDDDTRRGFFGGMLSTQIGDHHPFVYGVVERDYNDDVANIHFAGPAGSSVASTRFAYNADYIGAGSTGALTDRLSYGLEIVYEGGTNLSNSFTSSGGTFTPIPQTTDNIRAYAGDLRLDYTPADVNRSRFSGEVLLSSGDSDRQVTNATVGGNRPNTPDLAFNTLGLIDTGLAFNPVPSNLTMFRVGASTFPLPQTALLRRLQIGSDLFVYLKSDVKAPIEEPTLRRRYLGLEPDFYVNWRITSDVTFLVRYGVFFPGDSIRSSHSVRQFLLMGVNVAL